MTVDSTSSIIGTGVIGAGVGALAGKKVFKNKALKKFSKEFLKSKNIDEYVRSRIEVNMENVHQLKHSKWAKAFKNISEKAKADYPKLVERFKTCKLKYIGGFAAIGLVASIGIMALVNHFSNKNKI